SVPNDCEAGADADLIADQNLVQVVDASDRLAFERHDQITLAQSGPFGGAVLLNRNDEDAGLQRQTVKSDDPPVNRHVLPGDTDVTAADFSVFNKPARYESR